MSVWELHQADLRTLMHLMGYEDSFGVRSLRDMKESVDWPICWDTAHFLCEQYIEAWGSNTDIQDALQYIEIGRHEE